jgi:hypothetical protein
MHARRIGLKARKKRNKGTQEKEQRHARKGAKASKKRSKGRRKKKQRQTR